MFNWAKQQLANVAGTQEPIHGPEAIQSVTQQARDIPFTELTDDDLNWTCMDSTCVETKTFYVVSETGQLAMLQALYSNVAGIRITAQFNAKIFSQDPKTPHLWNSEPLENFTFDDKKRCFRAKNFSLDLSEDGNSYTFTSSVNPKNIVNLKFTKTAPGFMVGKNGTSTYGTDPTRPWGSMKHGFWPRCKVEGSFMTQDGEIKLNGRGLFSNALQGMKPHHAAARWNFVNFQSPTYSALMMEFTTPPSYGSTVVNVGGIATEGKILFAGANTSAKHTEIKGDPENDWPEPSSAEYRWEGKTSDGKLVEAHLGGSLGDRLDRVDVMAEVPTFVKNIVAGAVGTKPYIYQFGPKLKLTIDIDGEEHVEEGTLFTEATFIS